MKIVNLRSMIAALAIAYFLVGSVESTLGQLFRRPQQRTTPNSTRTTRPATTPSTPKPEPAPPAEAPPAEPEPAPRVAPRVAPRIAPTVTPPPATRGPLDSAGPSRGVELVELTGAKRHALLIGVNSFVKLTPLDYCVADVAALAGKLKDLDFEVSLLVTGAEAKDDPIASNINERIDSFLQRIGKDDMVVFAFSGHGARIGGASYLCPKDANIKDINTMISLKDVKERLDKKGRFRMLFIDACRNDLEDSTKASLDVAASAKAFVKSIEDSNVPNGTVMMNSCMAEEYSYEDEDLGHGVFMYHVLQGLEGRADGVMGGTDGFVSLTELKKFVSDGTNTHVWKKFSANQRPLFHMNMEMPDFAICRANVVPEPEPIGGTNPLIVATLRNISLERYDQAMEACDGWIRESATEEIGYRCRCMVLAARRELNDITMALYYKKHAGLDTITIGAKHSDKVVDILNGEKIVAQFKPGDTIEIDRILQDDWVSVVTHNKRPIRGAVSLSDLEKLPEKKLGPQEIAIKNARQRIDSATDTEHLNAAVGMLSAITDPNLKAQAERMRAEALLMIGISPEGSQAKVTQALTIAGMISNEPLVIRTAASNVKLHQKTGYSGNSVSINKGDTLAVDVTYTDHPHMKIVAVNGDTSRTGFFLIPTKKSVISSEPSRPNTWTRQNLNTFTHNLTGRTWIVRWSSGSVAAAQKDLSRHGYRLPTRTEVIHAINNGMKANIPQLQRNVWTTSGLFDTQTGAIVGVLAPGLESNLGIR